MNHDGSGDARGCSSSQYIMSPSVGPGKTTWSTCSTKVMHSFLRQSTCLDDGAPALGATKDTAWEGRTMKHGQNRKHQRQILKPQKVMLDSLLRKTPGFSFPLQEQCKAMYGRDYLPALTKEDLCKYLYCTNGVVTRPAHPALEGSFCGSHRVCIAGRCEPEEEIASLLGYNIPGSNTPILADTLPSATQPTTTSAPLAMPCSEDPPTADSALPWKPCINDTSIESPASCDCNPQATIPVNIDSIPKDICPFLAPVYHKLFKCSSECPLFDLQLDLTSGNLTQMLIGPNLLSDLSQSCIFEHYSVIRGQGKNTMNTMFNSIPHVSHMDPEICRGLPQFLHPSFGCPNVESEKHDCIPQNIIVKTATENITYTLSQGQTHRSILWKGTHYSLRTESDDGHQNSTDSHIFSIHTGHESPIINCNLEAIFPDVLQNVPSDVCPFIAPILHGLFNCFEDRCADYAVTVNLQEQNVTKIPLLKNLPRDDSCPTCVQERTGIEAILSEIIQTAIQSLSEYTFLCKLLPSSLLAFIPGCFSASTLEAISEDACPPMAIVVETGTAAFTYSLDSKQHGTDLHQLKWHGRLFSLLGISTDKDSLLVLRDKHSLNVNNSVTRKYGRLEMEVMSRHRNNTTSLKSSSLGGNHHNYTPLVDLADEPLVEYIGQSDKFLPLNAPTAMPRTRVGECSVTCGRGVRIVEQECVDVLTEEVLDSDSCQGYAVPKPEKESCVLPDCLPPQWKVGDWGECQQCGTGVQFRKVQCVIPAIELQDRRQDIGVGFVIGELVTNPVLVVEDQQCGSERPVNVQGCHKVCPPEPIIAEENNIEIAKDFDY